MSTTLLARPDDTHRQVLDDVETVLGQLLTPTDTSAGPAGSAPDPVHDPVHGVGSIDPDRALPGQCRFQSPREPGVSELWVSCLACEAELVADLNRAHGASHELVHGHHRTHTWRVQGHEVTLRADYHTLVLYIT